MSASLWLASWKMHGECVSDFVYCSILLLFSPPVPWFSTHTFLSYFSCPSISWSLFIPFAVPLSTSSSPSSLTLSTWSANIMAHGLYTHSTMRQYIGAGDFTCVSSEAKRAFAVIPSCWVVISVDHTFPLTSPARKAEEVVLVRHHSRRAVKAKLFLQHKEQAASIFHISLEY